MDWLLILLITHLLRRVNFYTRVDHLALTFILKSKSGPTTSRIKRLLEVLSSYTFSLYYLKGKDMVLVDFLSGMERDDVIPMSVNPSIAVTIIN